MQAPHAGDYGEEESETAVLYIIHAGISNCNIMLGGKKLQDCIFFSFFFLLSENSRVVDVLSKAA